MLKIFKYTIKDMLRSKWVIVYFLFFFLSTIGLLYFSNNLSKGIISLMNIVLVIVPLMSTLIGVIYYYNSSEFVELLLSQPIKRSVVFLGKYFGLATSMTTGLILGMGLPFLFYGIFFSSEILNFLMLILIGVFLTFIFIALAFLASLRFTDRIKGFGLSIAIWLFLAVIYDGLFLLALVAFRDYPMEKTALIISVINPIDVCRTMIMLKLDIAALLGYTGAVFKSFFGTQMGMFYSLVILLLWIASPILLMLRVLKRRDF